MPAYGKPPPDGNVSRATAFIIMFAVTHTIASVLICLRLYVRVRIVRALALDDLFIVLAWVIHTHPFGFLHFSNLIQLTKETLD